MSSKEIQKDDLEEKYLVFRLAGENYAAPLLQVKEVVKMVTPRAVPFTVDYFLGLINLRGQILSLVDLRAKLSLRGYDKKSGMILVVETKNGSIGAVVDSIENVRKINPGEIELNAMIETKVSNTSFKGVAKSEGDLLVLIDIRELLYSEDMKKITKAVEAA